jgi:hypothetical protein
MKKSLIVVLLIALLGLPVFATADPAIVQLKVVIDTNLTLSTTISSIATLSALDNLIGSVTVGSNGSAWKVEVKSTNGGFLKATDTSNTTHYPYTLKVGTVDNIDLSNTTANPLNTYKVVGTDASATFPINVKFAATPAALGLPAGTYTDQLYITLSTN